MCFTPWNNFTKSVFIYDVMKEVDVEILIAGDGKNYPTSGNTVLIHYAAFLPNGVQFDSVRTIITKKAFFLEVKQISHHN